MYKLFVILIFLSFSLFSQDTKYLAILDNLKFAVATENLSEAECEYVVATDDYTYMLLNGELYDSEFIQGQEHAAPSTCKEALETLLYFAANDASQIINLYDEASQAFIAALPATTRQANDAAMAKITSLELINRVVLSETTTIIFSRMIFEGNAEAVVIPWQFTEENGLCRIKAGKIELLCLNNLFEALMEDGVQFHETFLALEPVNVSLPMGQEAELIAKAYGATLPEVLDWKVDSETITDGASRTFVWQASGEHQISLSSTAIPVAMPAKIRVIELGRVQKVIQEEEVVDVTDEEGNIQRNVLRPEVEDVLADEVSLTVGEELKLRVLSSSPNFWPKDLPTWQLVDLDNNVVQEVTGNPRFNFTATAIGEYEVLIKCGLSVKRLTLIIEDDVEVSEGE